MFKKSLLTQRSFPFEIVEREPVNILQDFRPKRAYVNGKATDEIEGQVYLLVNTGTFDTFEVTVLGDEPVISPEDLRAIQENGEHVFVELEKATIRPYVNNSGMLADVIRAEGIRIVDADLTVK